MHGGRQARQLLESEFREGQPAVSPDSRWIAYVSTRSGILEIWIASYPDLHGLKRVTTDGAIQPWWSHDGKKLYYATLDNRKLMEIAFDPVRGEVVGQPKQIFERQDWFKNLSNYDVTQDGQFLLVVEGNPAFDATAPKPLNSRINIVLNWFEELKQKVPTGKK
jgi:Tol biopolymer transport system component